jgi:hypothetical protein
MSAVSAPQGFLPVFHPSGQIVANTYYPTVASGPTSAIFKGDPVKLTGDTTVVSLAGDSDAICGVFAGCEYTDVDGKPTYKPYWPGTTSGATNIVFYVYDDMNIIYEAQGAGSVANTAIGDSCDSTAATGSTYTGVSAVVLKTGTLSGAATVKQWRIVGLGQQVTNAWGDAFTVLRVRVGLNQFVSEPNAI